MAHDSKATTASRLQGLLLLTALSSTMSSFHGLQTPYSDTIFMSDLSGDGVPDEQPPADLPVFPFEDSASLARGGPLPGGPFEAGDPDMALCDMLLNAPLPLPNDQVPWFCICSRCKRSVGPKGDRGDRGLTGRPGSPGRRGLTGFKGRPGFRGRQGLKGQKGTDGDKGDQGPMGFSGAKGARGYKGDKGDQGLEGPQGVDGPQGESGMCPASCDSVEGPPGVPGIPGTIGARGLPGLQGSNGAKGVKGDTGDMGAPGVPGMDGDKGDEGEQGICNCTDGADGVDGKPGHQGPKGDQGDVGPPGPLGLVGEKGDLGEMGMMGMPGPCSPAIQSAFSACLAVPYPLPDMPVPFPHVHSNRQMDFNPTEGIYTAPVNGTYVFSYHLSVFSKVLKVGLFHNYNPIVITTEATNMASTSHLVVLHLTRFDRVWLQVKDITTNGMYTDNESSSTFSGFLLHPDSCLPPLGRHWPDEDQHHGPFTWSGTITSTVSPTPEQA